MIQTVILCGGSGTRLWPLSRSQHPKQFLALYNDTSLLQNTLQRVDKYHKTSPPLLMTQQDHRFMVAEQLRQANIEGGQIILEPCARNTAPAIAAAAFVAQNNGHDPILLVLPADHAIQQQANFDQAINTAIEAAESNHLVIFGVKPTRAETGYGYIKAASRIADNIHSVEGFYEKPDLSTAEKFHAEESYLWNSGMFCFKASVYLEALQQHAPAIYQACQKAVSNGQEDYDFWRLDKMSFEQCPSNSIDYAVMEKTKRAVVVPLDAGWSDIGSWSALWELGEKDEAHNVCQGDIINYQSQNCLLHSQNKLLAAIGLEDLIVIDTPDALLVAERSQSQAIKTVVGQIAKQNRSEHSLHRKVYRPWGSYDSIDLGERFQVKRLTVNPLAELSLQKHYHRAEHWVVVSGSARVTRDDAEFILYENESTYLPIGCQHRLANPGKIPLEIIEIQTGSYLGEDDIERFEDVYGR